MKAKIFCAIFLMGISCKSTDNSEVSETATSNSKSFSLDAELSQKLFSILRSEDAELLKGNKVKEISDVYFIERLSCFYMQGQKNIHGHKDGCIVSAFAGKASLGPTLTGEFVSKLALVLRAERMRLGLEKHRKPESEGDPYVAELEMDQDVSQCKVSGWFFKSYTCTLTASPRFVENEKAD